MKVGNMYLILSNTYYLNVNGLTFIVGKDTR